MKKLIFILLISILFLNGCLDKKAANNGIIQDVAIEETGNLEIGINHAKQYKAVIKVSQEVADVNLYIGTVTGSSLLMPTEKLNNAKVVYDNILIDVNEENKKVVINALDGNKKVLITKEYKLQ